MVNTHKIHGYKVIVVRQEIADKIKQYGQAGDSYNDAITNMLKIYNNIKKD